MNFVSFTGKEASYILYRVKKIGGNDFEGYSVSEYKDFLDTRFGENCPNYFSSSSGVYSLCDDLVICNERFNND